jgi:transcriptional regulator NrdR family protein
MATIEAIFRAVKIINPNAQMSIIENNLDSIIWENETTPISKSDIEAKLEQAQNELDAEAQAEIDNKTSAQNKLKALGLTDAEIEAL